MRSMNLTGPYHEKDPLEDVRFPGWYRDVDGGVCIVYKDTLVSLRYDSGTSECHVCADVLGPRGLYDKNVLWNSYGSITRAKQEALAVICNLRNGVPLV